MGGLIGTATPEKNGLVSKNQIYKAIPKGNGLHFRLILNIREAGQVFNGILYVTTVDGVVSAIAVSAAIWNENRVYCKLINGNKGHVSSLSYIKETNSISLFVNMTNYAQILFVPFTAQYASFLETVSLIPSGTVNIDF